MKKMKLFREFVSNQPSIDARLQELKDLIDNISDNNIIYEWENKSDHEVVVNFTKDGTQIRYEFDIDQFLVTKFEEERHVFSQEVTTTEEGMEIIERDIQKILGIHETKSVDSDNLGASQGVKKFPQLDIEKTLSMLQRGISIKEIAIELEIDINRARQIVEYILKRDQIN